jgi:hypothetical protein
MTIWKQTLNILNVQKKGPFLNTLEKFNIYKTTKSGKGITIQFLMRLIETVSTWYK